MMKGKEQRAWRVAQRVKSMAQGAMNKEQKTTNNKLFLGKSISFAGW
jgi:hypothetical protein